jgi:diguanylate cyclase (GGDEF)-like protein
VLRIVGLVRQVEEQSDQLAALARHDGLTGIPNRRTWDRELPVAMDRARRDDVPLSVAILDLDHFKHFNDRFGHQAGDRLLKSATTAWSQLLRSTDLLCRYGGEEFSVLLPDATIEQAAEVLERLRRITPRARPSRPASPAGMGKRPPIGVSPAPTARCTQPRRAVATASPWIATSRLPEITRRPRHPDIDASTDPVSYLQLCGQLNAQGDLRRELAFTR